MLRKINMMKMIMTGEEEDYEEEVKKKEKDQKIKIFFFNL
jgi:hypothetical protein